MRTYLDQGFSQGGRASRACARGGSPEDRRKPLARQGRTRRLRRRHLPTRNHPRPRGLDPVHAGQRRGRIILRPGDTSVAVPALGSSARPTHRAERGETSYQQSAFSGQLEEILKPLFVCGRFANRPYRSNLAKSSTAEPSAPSFLRERRITRMAIVIASMEAKRSMLASAFSAGIGAARAAL